MLCDAMLCYVQAQTVANFYLAFEHELAIVPMVNKVDLAHAITRAASSHAPRHHTRRVSTRAASPHTLLTWHV